VFVVLTVVGMIGLADRGVGFEEPYNTLLLTSFMLMLATPVAMLAHLSRTRDLTTRERRIWIARITRCRSTTLFATARCSIA